MNGLNLISRTAIFSILIIARRSPNDPEKRFTAKSRRSRSIRYLRVLRVFVVKLSCSLDCFAFRSQWRQAPCAAETIPTQPLPHAVCPRDQIPANTLSTPLCPSGAEGLGEVGESRCLLIANCLYRPPHLPIASRWAPSSPP